MSSVMGNISNSFMLETVSAPLFYVIYEFCYGKYIKQFHVGDGECPSLLCYTVSTW